MLFFIRVGSALISSPTSCSGFEQPTKISQSSYVKLHLVFNQCLLRLTHRLFIGESRCFSCFWKWKAEDEREQIYIITYIYYSNNKTARPRLRHELGPEVRLQLVATTISFRG